MLVLRQFAISVLTLCIAILGVQKIASASVRADRTQMTQFDALVNTKPAAKIQSTDAAGVQLVQYGGDRDRSRRGNWMRFSRQRPLIFPPVYYTPYRGTYIYTAPYITPYRTGLYYSSGYSPGYYGGAYPGYQRGYSYRGTYINPNVGNSY
ncbi:MAG: hypothetical protein R3C53_17830 [Pirellulaceae bacterium]